MTDSPVIRRALTAAAAALALLAPLTDARAEAEPTGQTTVEAVEAPNAEGSPQADDTLQAYRSSFDMLADRAIGTASRPVEFNWRRTDFQLAVAGHHPSELNTFGTLRGGLLGRLPTKALLLEFGLGYARVWDTPGSRLLSRTPYRQAGRPSRLELDFAVVFPLAEGVVTTAPKIFPAAQVTLNAIVDFRYLLYTNGFANMGMGNVAGALFSPTLTDAEIKNLEGSRPIAMQIDPGRYGLMAGVGNDIYFKNGMFVSPRLLVAVPLLAPATKTDLKVWADASVALGWAW